LRLSWLHIWLHAWLRSGFQRKEKKPLCGKGSRKEKSLLQLPLRHQQSCPKKMKNGGTTPRCMI